MTKRHGKGWERKVIMERKEGRVTAEHFEGWWEKKNGKLCL